MANLSKSDTLFAFTSPRTIEKIIPEIDLLVQNFSGEIWSGNDDVQSRFFNLLFDSGFYDGDKKPNDIPFAARDRITRAPKALGFVNLSPQIALTEAGDRLLSGKRAHETITRQLMKFQLPSPYHTDKEERFYVKPYLELLRLVYELDGLSKSEIAIFFLQLTHIDKYSEIKSKIEAFRAEAKTNKTNRKAFIEAQFDAEVRKIYVGKIRRQQYDTRETSEATPESFLSTKKSNMRDYADAFMRYMRATQLVTFNSRSVRLKVSAYRKDEVVFLLNNTERPPTSFKSKDAFEKFLFTPDTVRLLTDDYALLMRHISTLETKLKSRPIVEKKKLDLEELKDYLSALEEQQKKENLIQATQKLKSYEELPDILSIFGQIQNRELPDAPLYLEWNIWRALTMLNYAIQIEGNFTFDLDGAPLSTAGGNKPDIECEYDTFKLIVEVTMSSGNTQFNMEGESVPRHYGKAKQASSKPVYCLFIAPKISEGALAHFFNLNRLNTKAYGGKTQIVPMSLAHFIDDFIRVGVQKSFSQSQALENLFKQALKINASADDEVAWLDQTIKLTQQWL